MKKRHEPHFLTLKTMLISLQRALFMITPKRQIKNPAMFVAYLAALVTTLCLIDNIFHGQPFLFTFNISIWLWCTVLFANFAEALAESRGKAQAASLRRTQEETFAKVYKNGKEERVSSGSLSKGDIVLCEAGDTIPADGEIIEGVACIDESAITGESAPVLRESGGDRSAVTAGTRVLSDRIKIRVVSEHGKSFLDYMISLIEGAQRQKTPNEIALTIVLSALTLIFILTTVSLKVFGDYSGHEAEQDLSHTLTIPVLAALLVCLIPTTISALLSAVGIAGIDRLTQRNVIALSGRAVEAAGDVSLLILDKTGTITIGNRMATAFIPAPGVSERELAKVAQLASLSDETPEGRSIVVLAKNLFQLRTEELHAPSSTFLPFSAATKMSGVDILDEEGRVIRRLRKGSSEAIRKHIEALGGSYPQEMKATIEQIAKDGGTPLLVSSDGTVLGIIQLKDIVKGGIKERCHAMRKMGIRTVMVTGDNPLTAAAIAAEAGVDEYIAEATPEMKLAKIIKEQESGQLVAMMGDGTNDAPALAQADVAVAMNTGTQASREASNMVDLDSNPTKLIDIVEIGKQMLMTRGALTTFSIANDVAKYFAIIPAIFGTLYAKGASHGPLSLLNIMFLHSHQSAILSALIFNALIIIALIPLALKGVKYQPKPAHILLRKNIILYGGGGVLAPFFFIKLIDVLIASLMGIV